MANKDQETEKIQITEFDVDAFKDQAVGLFEKYKKIIYAVLFSIILVIGLLYFYFVLYKGPLEKKAEEEIFRAEQYFAMDSFKLALDGRNLPGQQGNFIGLLEHITQYGGTSAGARAYFMAGTAFLQLGNFQEAIKFLKNYSGSDRLIQAQVYGMLGDASSEVNKIDDAFNYYMKAADYFPNKATTPIHLRKAALLMSDVKKNNAEAIKILEKIKKEYPLEMYQNSESNSAVQIARDFLSQVDKDIVRLGGK